MASPSSPSVVNHLRFDSVQILYQEELGVGSYGKVYKAKCDQLPCAAKLLHDTMFEGGDPGRFKFAQRFERECQFLSMIKHPNIVQYLGTIRDAQSQRLSLLMELMDESLTKFLERSPGPLPYHIQLNICHDVALALSYLHSNAIIHRDLSSNNVLLIGEGSRAKVTDFGMSKLNPRTTPLTQCPGAQVYMPPEALTNPPHYSSKLDCFSHGVLTIQVITRNFPDPSDAHQSIQDPSYSTGYIIVPFPETERRRKDIDLIEPNHPLLPIALHCLKDRDIERPSADEVCERLATLKRDEQYLRCAANHISNIPLIERLNEEIIQKDQHIRDLEERCELIRNYQAERAEHQRELEAIRRQNELLQEEVARQRANHQIPRDPLPMKIAWRHEEAPEGLGHETAAIATNGAIYFLHHTGNIHSYAVSEGKWTELPSCKYHKFGLAVIEGQVTTIGGFIRGPSNQVTNALLSLTPGKHLKKSWQVLLPSMRTGRAKPAVVATHTHLVVAGGLKDLRGMREVEVLDFKTMQWSSAECLPQPITPQMTLCGECLYVSHRASVLFCFIQELLQSCSSSHRGGSESVWKRVANIPIPFNAALVTMGEHVMAIGGSEGEYGMNNLSTIIHCYDKGTNKWGIAGNIPAPGRIIQATVVGTDKLALILNSCIYIGHFS